MKTSHLGDYSGPHGGKDAQVILISRWLRRPAYRTTCVGCGVQATYVDLDSAWMSSRNHQCPAPNGGTPS